MILHHRQYGHNGPVLVILHGLFGMSENWQMVARKLESEIQVIALDLRNHGLSPHASEMTLRQMAEDVHETLLHLGIAEFYLLGHSMGGKVAMEFAFMYPEQLTGLIIADISPKAYKPGHTEIFQAMLNVDFGKVSTRNDIDAQLSTLIPEPAVRMFIMKNIARSENGQYEWRFNLQGIFEGYADIIGNVSGVGLYSGRVLVLYGEKANYVTPKDFPLFEKHFPNAVFHGIADAGHWIHAEKPEETANMIKSFVLKT